MYEYFGVHSYYFGVGDSVGCVHTLPDAVLTEVSGSLSVSCWVCEQPVAAARGVSRFGRGAGLSSGPF